MKKMLIVGIMLFSLIMNKATGQELNKKYIIDSVSFVSETEGETEAVFDISFIFYCKEACYFDLIKGNDTAIFKAISNLPNVERANVYAKKFTIQNVKTGIQADFGIFLTYKEELVAFAIKMGEGVTIFWIAKDIMIQGNGKK